MLLSNDQAPYTKFSVANTFGELFDFRIAYNAILSAYALVFKGTPDADFFTYAEAKSRLKGKQAALKALYVAASHNIMDPKYTYGRNLAEKAGIYPHCFLNKNAPVAHLDNPLKLLARKLNTIRALE